MRFLISLNPGCAPGTGAVDAGYSCEPCAIGFFQNSTAGSPPLQRCVACPEGFTTTDIGSSTCDVESSTGGNNNLEDTPYLEEGALSVNLLASSFVDVSSSLIFTLSGVTFDQSSDPAPVLEVNGVVVPPSQLQLEAAAFTATGVLTNGRNDIYFTAYDSLSRPLYYTATFWAGDAVAVVKLVYETDRTPFLLPTTVSAKLADETTVSGQTTTSNGEATFTNIPERTIFFEAKSGNFFGTTGVAFTTSGTTTITIEMFSFNTPSTIDNNDLSLGTTDGWDFVAGTPVTIVPHKEEIFPAGVLNTAPLQSIPKTYPPRNASSRGAVRKMVAKLEARELATTDNDIQLVTFGEGEQRVSRTITTEPGQTAVGVRYRFITSEVPGGYFGSKFNDYFLVSIRSQKGGTIVYEKKGMNELGLASFVFATGETNWRSRSLVIDPTGDVIQVDVRVANVGDDLLDSWVIVDFIEQVSDQVQPSLVWDNIKGGLKLSWKVLGNLALTKDVNIKIYFSGGATCADKLAYADLTYLVPQGTAAGATGSFQIPGGALANNPSSTTHIIAASSPSLVGSVSDVKINFAPNANQNVVTDSSRDLIKDALRAAGVSTGVITSTLRTAASQAKAMYDNCVNDVGKQLTLYGAAGRQVIQVYIDLSNEGASAATIKQAMEEKIIEVGPQNVSKHCSDSPTAQVLDVADSSFNANNRPLFISHLKARGFVVLDEPYNKCIHVQISL